MPKISISLLNLLKRAVRGGNFTSSPLETDAFASPTRTIFKKLFKNPRAIIGFIGFASIFILCFLGSYLLPINETYIELTHSNLRPGMNYLDFPHELNEKNVVKISSGISFSAAITDDGDFYIWGTEPNKEQANVSTYIFDVPSALYQNKVVDISCGANHIIAIDEHNNIYAWGYNSNGQTDIPNEISKNLSHNNIKQIDSLSQYNALLLDNGELDIWGSTQAENNFLISSKTQGRIAKFALSDNNIALLLDDGTIEIIGDRGSEFYLNKPENLPEIVDIVATNRNVLALDIDGNLHSFGALQDGLSDISNNEKIVSISSGYGNFITLSESGAVSIYGSDTFSQLNLPNLSSIDKIFADYYQFYIISDDNNVTPWGNNGYLFGTDEFGRDIFTRIIHGGRVSLTVGAIAVFISCTIALIVGLSSGYFGGIIDSILMRITDVFSAIPFFPIAITISYAVGFSLDSSMKLFLIMVVLGLLGWMSLARLIRAQLLLEREKDFVLAARALGLKNHTIMWRHIFPNVLNIVIVNITLGYASSLLSEAALSFLGFGVAEPTPSWGNMLNSAQEVAVIEFYWWRWIIPALFVIITAVCINFIGDALRDAIDPKSSEK